MSLKELLQHTLNVLVSKKNMASLSIYTQGPYANEFINALNLYELHNNVYEEKLYARITPRGDLHYVFSGQDHLAKTTLFSLTKDHNLLIITKYKTKNIFTVILFLPNAFIPTDTIYDIADFYQINSDNLYAGKQLDGTCVVIGINDNIDTKDLFMIAEQFEEAIYDSELANQLYIYNNDISDIKELTKNGDI